MPEQIPGVPLGMRIKALRSPGEGLGGAFNSYHVEFEPDNVYGLDLDSVLIPEGYERDGNCPKEWFRTLKAGDLYVPMCDGSVPYLAETSDVVGDRRRIIVRRKKTKKRFVIVEAEVPTEARIDSVAWCGSNDLLHNVPFRIEEREL